MIKKKGVLLVNLGTPSAPTPKAVRRYLRTFLGDPRVLDIPAWARFFLLNGVILPKRPYATAKAYQAIWDPEKGSPLLYLSASLTEKLQAKLGDAYRVCLAMRYEAPNLETVVPQILKEVESLTVIPLYPQYASSTTGSTVEKLFSILQSMNNIPSLEIITDFYQAPWYINALSKQARPYLETVSADHVLMSFHGLPVRHIQKSECTPCPQDQPCPAMRATNRYCYRAHCYATARSLADALSLDGNYSVAFQSRLGRVPWIKPYSDEILHDLFHKGVRRLAVMCPSFITDCLETLEEINMGLREQWLKMGGQSFNMIPCLNDSAPLVEALAQVIKETHPQDTAIHSDKVHRRVDCESSLASC